MFCDVKEEFSMYINYRDYLVKNEFGEFYTSEISSLAFDFCDWK